MFYYMLYRSAHTSDLEMREAEAGSHEHPRRPGAITKKLRRIRPRSGAGPAPGSVAGDDAGP